MVAANVLLDDDDCIKQVRIAVGACSAVAQRMPELEAALVGLRPCDIEITPVQMGNLTPIDDVRGSGAYRSEAAAILCQRTIRKAANR